MSRRTIALLMQIFKHINKLMSGHNAATSTRIGKKGHSSNTNSWDFLQIAGQRRTKEIILGEEGGEYSKDKYKNMNDLLGIKPHMCVGTDPARIGIVY